ncbi:MAG: sugar-binding protein [Symploca sp. SIO3E6]|nr:sugar-binding protein [Caldora sp. SIO3E6]
MRYTKSKLLSGIGLSLFVQFFLIDFVNAHDFPKLDEAIPNYRIAQLAPVFDFDGDGCLPGTGISRNGRKNGGLKPTGSITGKCRSSRFMDTSNTFHRSHCMSQNGSQYCGHFYALYFEKDQAAYSPFEVPSVDIPDIGTLSNGHRHDWEVVAVWTKDNVITHGSVSHHGKPKLRKASDIPFENGHMKVVYHQHNVRTHAFRFASRNERAENPYRRFVTPTIVSWYSLVGDGINNYGMRSRLNSFDYGHANLQIVDRNFANKLNQFKPSEYPSFVLPPLRII